MSYGSGSVIITVNILQDSEPEPEPVVTDAAQVPPVDNELDKAIQQDLNKRGLAVVKTFKPKAKITLD